MRDEIVDLNDGGTFTRKQYKERHGLAESTVTKVLKAMLDAGTIIKVATGSYRYVPGLKSAPAGESAFDIAMTVDVPVSTLDDVMADMGLGWLEGKAIELIAHHDSIADVEQAIGCLKSILRHQYSG